MAAKLSQPSGQLLMQDDHVIQSGEGEPEQRHP
jgi:hypothetical protein